MEKVIFDFRDFIKREIGHKPSIQLSPNDFYFTGSGHCPFCRRKSIQVLNDSVKSGSNIDYLRNVLEIWECECGWWEVLESTESDFYGAFSASGILKSGILRKLEASSPNLPIAVLQKELLNKPEILYHIHNKKMEELAASVLSNFYKCEVVLCGQSHDRGIDLLLIESDQPTVVQVKRRCNPEKVESVAEIRHLLGVTLLADSRSCVYVTTSDHFSIEAQSTVSAALTKKIVDKFELFDVHRFLDVLRLVTKKPNPYWKSVISSKWRNRINALDEKNEGQSDQNMLKYINL
jgi:hypothetical protein